MLARDMVKAAMLARGWTQRELADAVNKSAAYVSDVLAGRRAISVNLAKSFGEALGLKPLELLNAQNADILEGHARDLRAPAERKTEATAPIHKLVTYCPRCGDEMVGKSCNGCAWPEVRTLAPRKSEGAPSGPKGQDPAGNENEAPAEVAKNVSRETFLPQEVMGEMATSPGASDQGGKVITPAPSGKKRATAPTPPAPMKCPNCDVPAWNEVSCSVCGYAEEE